jgi:drug/metabolite transporter superfamily protein YnfA
MNIKNKIPWTLVMGTVGVTVVGALNGTAIMGIASAIFGGLAMVTALLLRQEIEKKRLKPELAMELR